jgi:hypothetical protein
MQGCSVLYCMTFLSDLFRKLEMGHEATIFMMCINVLFSFDGVNSALLDCVITYVSKDAVSATLC